MPRLILIFCLLWSGAASAAEPGNWYRTANVVAHDADTVRCDILFPWHVTLAGVSVRAHGFDAWEVTRTRQTVSISPAEIAKGKQALAEFNALLAHGRLELSPLEYDGSDSVYGRLEAKWRIVADDGSIVDLAEYAKAHGWVRKP